MTKKLQYVKGNYQFNTDVLPGRHPMEEITSVQYRPGNSTGEFRTFGPFDPFEEKRGMLNSTMRHFFQMDVPQGEMFHRYASHNPERVGGALGWIGLKRLENMIGEEIVEGEKALRLVSFPGADGEFRQTEIMLPHRKDERISSGPKRGEGKIVTLEPTAWLRIVELGGGRLELSNAPTDTRYSGKQLGVVLHSYLEELFHGVQMTTSCQITPMKDKETGQTIWLQKLQDIAKNLRIWSEMDYAAAREAYVADWRGKASIQHFTNQIAFVATPELEQQVTEIEEAVAQGLPVPEERQLFVLVDGVATPIQNILDGTYSIVKYRGDGTEIGRDGLFPVNIATRHKLGQMGGLQGARGLSTKLS